MVDNMHNMLFALSKYTHPHAYMYTGANNILAHIEKYIVPGKEINTLKENRY